jgi:hypothetical protein
MELLPAFPKSVSPLIGEQKLVNARRKKRRVLGLRKAGATYHAIAENLVFLRGR